MPADAGGVPSGQAVAGTALSAMPNLEPIAALMDSIAEMPKPMALALSDSIPPALLQSGFAECLPTGTTP
jgi:hypothetical protein